MTFTIHVQRLSRQLRKTLLGRQVGGHSGGNAVWGAMEAASSPLAALVMAGGLVRILGPSEYGLIVVALAVTALCGASTSAIGITVIKFIAEAMNERKEAKVASIMTASLMVVTTINCVFLLTAILFSAELTDEIFGKRAAEVEPHLGFILLLAVAAACIQQLDGVFAGVIKGFEYFRRQSLIEMSARTSQVVLSIVAAWISRNVLVVLTTYCAVCAISAGVRLTVLRQTVGKIGLLTVPEKSDLYRILQFGGWMWLNAVATVAFGTVDRIVLGRVAGPAVVAKYNIFIQLAQLTHFIPASLFAFSLPVFSRLGANVQLNMRTIRSLYWTYFRLAGIIGVSLGLILFTFKRVILSLFGTALVQGQDITAFDVLIASYVNLALAIIPYYLGLGLGKAKAVSLVTSISMFASIATTIWLTQFYGMDGAAFGRLIYGLGVLTLFFQAQVHLRWT